MELNSEFKNNWRKILNYNALRTRSKDKIDDIEVRIPLTPIEVNASVLYLLSKILYPRFVSDQQNILDIIVSEKENEIKNAYLYQTKKPGVHESIERLPIELFKDKKGNLSNIDFTNKEALFTHIQQNLFDKKQVKIASIRFFNESIQNLINKLCSVDIFESTLEFYCKFSDFVQEIVEKKLIFIYPETNIIIFLEKFFSILTNIKLSNLIALIGELLPQTSIGFLITHNKDNFFVRVSKGKFSSGKNPFEIKVVPIVNKARDTLDKILKKEDLNVAFQFQFEDLIYLAQDLFNLNFPLKREEIQFFSQKVIFGLRSYEHRWNRAPRLILFNLKRLFVRILGINLNIKKVSHWSVPTTFIQTMFTSLGLNAKILVLYTDIQGSKGKTKLKFCLKKSVLLEFENGALTKLSSIPKNQLITNEPTTLNTIKHEISEIIGNISLVFKIDKLVLSKILYLLIFQTPTLNFFKILKILKLIRNDNYLNVYPRIPFVSFMKNTGSFKTLKLLSSILVDKHEF